MDDSLALEILSFCIFSKLWTLFSNLVWFLTPTFSISDTKALVSIPAKARWYKSCLVNAPLPKNPLSTNSPAPFNPLSSIKRFTNKSMALLAFIITSLSPLFTASFLISATLSKALDISSALDTYNLNGLNKSASLSKGLLAKSLTSFCLSKCSIILSSLSTVSAVLVAVLLVSNFNSAIPLSPVLTTVSV